MSYTVNSLSASFLHTHYLSILLFLAVMCSLFCLDQKPALPHEAHSSMRGTFIRFTLERQNKAVWRSYISMLCSHQQSALLFQVDRTDARQNRLVSKTEVKCRH